MSNTVFNEIKYKVFRSGSRLNLFIGINVLFFLVVKLIQVLEFIFQAEWGLANWIVLHVSMPPYLPNLLYKFWTPFTYMFAHAEFFHILWNMLWLFWMGRIFEDFLSRRQFTFTYLAGGLAGALLFIAAFNLLPAFSDNVMLSPPLIGASASVMAIVVATATLLPDYTIMLLLIGPVRLKWLAIVYIVLDIIGILDNPGGSFAHLGGAILGFVFIKQLQKGNDWSKLFEKKPRLRVVKNHPVKRDTPKTDKDIPDQELIDRLLDKISQSGYDSLSKKEKEQLFNASKKSQS